MYTVQVFKKQDPGKRNNKNQWSFREPLKNWVILHHLRYSLRFVLLHAIHKCPWLHAIRKKTDFSAFRRGFTIPVVVFSDLFTVICFIVCRSNLKNIEEPTFFQLGKGNHCKFHQREVRRHSSPEVSMALSCVNGSILMSLKEHDVMTGELANLLSGENWEANTCWKRWKATGCHCFFHVFVIWLRHFA